MNGNTNIVRNLIIDMDGVLWRGDTPMQGLVGFFETLRRLDIGFVLATNNATRTATQYAQKLRGFGVLIPEEQILNSAEATALYMSKHYSTGSEVYVIGEDGLKTAISNQGFTLLSDNGILGSDAKSEAVVIGLARDVSYRQFANATYLINRGATFIGTNPDVTFPTENGLMPGAGALLSFVQAATSQEPLVIGKPGRAIFDEALRRLVGSPDDTVMVGDRIATDIVGGQAAGMRTALLLSGVSSRDQLANVTNQPDWVFADLTSFAHFLASDLSFARSSNR